MFGCAALKLTRLAKLSLAGVDPLLPVGALPGGFWEEDGKDGGFGVDLPDIGGVGRNAG